MNQINSELLNEVKAKLSEGGRVKFTVTGNSMSPMLVDKKSDVIIESPIFPLKKYDIAFYLRENGTLVLHRVVTAGSEGYSFRGDNELKTERGVKEEQIIGIVRAASTDGSDISLNSRKYKIYCVRRNVGFVFRKLFNKLKKPLGKNL